MSNVVLDAAGICRTYGRGERRIEVLRELDLAVEADESVAIVGESGIGKSTLLHILGGLDRPERGRLHFGGRDLKLASPQDLAEIRNREIGFIFQFHHLLPEFTALENVEMPLRIAGRHDGRDEARGLLERIGMGDRLEHIPGRLSGGEQQRVAIARSIVNSPSLVLADEPTGNLDPATGAAVFTTLKELHRERAFAIVLVTHNERLARGCDRVLHMLDGGLTKLDEAATRAYFEARSPVGNSPG